MNPFLSISVETDGLVQKLQTVATQASDLDSVLSKFGSYMLKKAKARIDAQNYVPLADSTIKKRAAAGIRQLERKLVKDVVRAMKRDAKKVPRGLAARAMTSITGAQLAASVPGRGTQNRAAVLAEFRRIHKMGTSGLMEKAGGKTLTMKQNASLWARTGRAVAKAISKAILGQLNRAPIFEVSSGVVTVSVPTRTHFSAVHDEGGVAGHGAKEPKRVMLEIEADDIEFLAKLLAEHCLAGWDDA